MAEGGISDEIGWLFGDWLDLTRKLVEPDIEPDIVSRDRCRERVSREKVKNGILDIILDIMSRKIGEKDWREKMKWVCLMINLSPKHPENGERMSHMHERRRDATFPDIVRGNKHNGIIFRIMDKAFVG